MQEVFCLLKEILQKSLFFLPLVIFSRTLTMACMSIYWCWQVQILGAVSQPPSVLSPHPPPPSHPATTNTFTRPVTTTYRLRSRSFPFCNFLYSRYSAGSSSFASFTFLLPSFPFAIDNHDPPQPWCFDVLCSICFSPCLSKKPLESREGNSSTSLPEIFGSCFTVCKMQRCKATH